MRYFIFLITFNMEKTGYENEIKTKVVFKGHKLVLKPRKKAVLMIFLVFFLIQDLSVMNLNKYK